MATEDRQSPEQSNHRERAQNVKYLTVVQLLIVKSLEWNIVNLTHYLELSTMYSTILSRTFSKRAVLTQMCLMAWAERG